MTNWIQDIETWQWIFVVASSVLMFVISPFSQTSSDFFKATDRQDKTPGLWVLTSSLVISWIFAKSITNAANLGMSFGLVGGLAYACYYLSFLVAGVVIYRMRTLGGYTSIHHFLASKFGRSAVVVFSLLIAFRLFNEVWSNTMVIGAYFGDKGSTSYYGAILLFTALTLAYVLKGGMHSSLLTDLIQMVFFGILLFVILGILLPREGGDVGRFVQSGTWSAGQGLNLMLAVLIQIFSYPFHDPILTDRGFLSPPKLTLQSFVLATLVGFICIVLFSFVGIYASFQGLSGEAPVAVSQTLGAGMTLLMNFIMITSAASTLDSTFASSAKLLVVDLGKAENVEVHRGRLAMVLVAIVGTIPVFLGPEILSATTISGTMVIGLAPVFLLWRGQSSSLAFHLSVGAGMLVGLLYALGWVPAAVILTGGKHSDLLYVNLWGTLGCFILYFLASQGGSRSLGRY